MLNINENTIRLTNKDRNDKADAYKRIIDNNFPSASKLKELANKVDKKELIRLDTMEFLHNIDYSIQEEALLGHTKLNIYFTDIKTKHVYITYPLKKYDELDWSEIINFLEYKGYKTSVKTYDHPQQGPLISMYRIFTIFWD